MSRRVRVERIKRLYWIVNFATTRRFPRNKVKRQWFASSVILSSSRGFDCRKFPFDSIPKFIDSEHFMFGPHSDSFTRQWLLNWRRWRPRARARAISESKHDTLDDDELHSVSRYPIRSIGSRKEPFLRLAPRQQPLPLNRLIGGKRRRLRGCRSLA